MRFNKATQIFLKLNQFSNTIQSPSSPPPPPPDDYNIFTKILMQLNEWLVFLPNLVHSLVANLVAFFPNLIHSIVNIFKKILMQLNEWLVFLPNLIHSLVAKLVAFFPNLIHSIVYLFKKILMELNEWLIFLPNLVHSLVAKLVAFFPNLIHSIVNIFKKILTQLNEWLVFLPNLVHSLVAKLQAFLPNFIHSIVAKSKEALPFVVAALGVVALCVFCYYFFSAIISCVTLVVRGCWICIKGLLTMVWHMCKMVFMCSGKMMVAPGTGGALLISRAVFEAAPQAYFAALRAAGAGASAGARILV